MFNAILNMGEVTGLSSLVTSKVGLAIVLLIISILLQSPISMAFHLSTKNSLKARRTSVFVESASSKQFETRNTTGTPDGGEQAKSSQPSLKQNMFDKVAVVFGKRKKNVRRLLDELSQPFMGRTSPLSNHEVEEMDQTVIVENNQTSTLTTTHFAFLVHGYHGNPADLLYLRTAMAAIAEKKKSNTTNQAAGQDRIVIHSCQSNLGRTGDGLENGGRRILGEVLSVIREYSPRDDGNGDEVVDISVSFVGNSLGGLYSRYAIARLSELSNSTDEEFILLEGNIRLYLNIFCSTATPHLGISGHLYFPLPRSAEVGIAKLLGETGRDIFRISDLVKTMCTCPSYLKPLRLFRKRIAYANAYHTDFVVPTSTAVFLNPDSTYPHHATNMNAIDSESESKNKNGMVVATFNTPQGKSSSKAPTLRDDETHDNPKKRPSLLSKSGHTQRQKDELLEMSNSLDSLGWKKVIVDVREHMPVSVKIPNIVRKRSGLETSSSTISVSDQIGKNAESKSPEKSSSEILESRDVASAFSIPEDVFAFPLGHNTMVAAENYSLSTVFKGGRPLMDDLAKEIIEEIFALDVNSSSRS